MELVIKPNCIIQGDCLDVLQQIGSGTVDLIYIDPPFSSNKNYTGIWEKTGEELSFEDVWEMGVKGYLDWLEPRIEQCFRVLKETGSFYIHCDWHAAQEIKVMIDRLIKKQFSGAKFRNEIIWKRTFSHADAKQYAFDVEKEDKVKIDLLTVEELLKRKTPKSAYHESYNVEVQKRLV
jgi:DNA modification methylase